MDVELTFQVKWLLAQFQEAGYECFLVGGCVRDLCLLRAIHDYDITTNATPQQMMEFLSRTSCKIIPTGIKHGTLTILYEEEAIEVTTYRIEQSYENHRRPQAVMFSQNLIEDLARRDFTINAMAFHPDIGLIDPFDGQHDLKQKLIRCVGNSEERFQEDALRMLRALRFSFQLQFELDSACMLAMQKNAHLLQMISKERIQEEFNRMLLSDAPQILSTLRKAFVLPYIIEEYPIIYDIPQECPWHQYDVFQHTDIALDHTVGYDLCEKLAIVFHDIGKAETKQLDEQGNAHFYGHPQISERIAKIAMKRLAYSNKQINRVLTLIHYHDVTLLPKRKCLRKLLSHIQMEYDLAYAILRVQRADDYAKDMRLAKDKLALLQICETELKEMESEEPALTMKELALNGHDLMALGYQGKAIGEVKQWLYHHVIEYPKHNTKEQLLVLLQTNFHKQ